MLVVLSPLCSLIPKLLSACAKQLAQTTKVDTNIMGDLDNEQIKIRFLRGDLKTSISCSFILTKRFINHTPVAVAACQHMLSSLLEDARPEPKAHRRLQDISSEEFESTRHVTELLDHPELLIPELSPMSNASSLNPPSLSPVASSPLTRISTGDQSVKNKQLSSIDKMEQFFESVGSKLRNNK